MMTNDGAPLVHQFAQAVEEVVDRFRDQGLTVSEALGALDLIHAGIIKDAQDGQENKTDLTP